MLTNFFKSTISTFALLGALAACDPSLAMEDDEQGKPGHAKTSSVEIKHLKLDISGPNHEENATELNNIFRQVTFTPRPERIELRNSIKVENGEIEVHFRDPAHLKKIVEYFPCIEAKSIFYILDSETQDNDELRLTDGTVELKKFINVVANQPLHLQGVIPSSPYSIVLPSQSQWRHLSSTIKGGISTGLPDYKRAIDLIQVIDHYDERILDIRTSDARKLLEKTKR